MADFFGEALALQRDLFAHRATISPPLALYSIHSAICPQIGSVLRFISARFQFISSQPLGTTLPFLPISKVFLTSFWQTLVFSETNFSFFQIYLGFGLTFVENMARILEGVKGIFSFCTGGGGLFFPSSRPAGLPWAGFVLFRPRSFPVWGWVFLDVQFLLLAVGLPFAYSCGLFSSLLRFLCKDDILYICGAFVASVGFSLLVIIIACVGCLFADNKKRKFPIFCRCHLLPLLRLVSSCRQ